jgi:hypothetical protein
MTKSKKPDWLDKSMASLEQAKAQALLDMQNTPRAIKAKFDARKKMVMVDLSNGATFGFPAHLAQGLESATVAQLSQIEISPMGTGLSWPLLDADLTVEGLLHGVFGGRAWMRAHAAKAGRVRSQAKAIAARANGALGGRPRKQTAAQIKA